MRHSRIGKRQGGSDVHGLRPGDIFEWDDVGRAEMVYPTCFHASASMRVSDRFFVSPVTMVISIPCIFPIAGARMSIFVSSTNCLASTEVVNPARKPRSRIVDLHRDANLTASMQPSHLSRPRSHIRAKN